MDYSASQLLEDVAAVWTTSCHAFIQRQWIDSLQTLSVLRATSKGYFRRSNKNSSYNITGVFCSNGTVPSVIDSVVNLNSVCWSEVGWYLPELYRKWFEVASGWQSIPCGSTMTSIYGLVEFQGIGNYTLSNVQ